MRSPCARGYRVRALIEQEAVGRISAARLVREEGAVVLDLLSASSGVEPELVAAAEHSEILPGLMVPLTTIGHLMVLKLLARDDRSRPQDADDLRRMLAVASDAEMARCVEALTLITGRGFHRGRDLVGAWRALLEDEANRG